MNLQYILSRAKEPSTWRGISILIGVLGIQANPEAINQIGMATGAVISAIEIFRKEK
jgi:hypothetical protein